MLQVKTFALPKEETAANDFLKTHKPMGEIARMGHLLFIGYEDGAYPAEYQIADLAELLRSNAQARLQQEIALHVMEYERADLNPKHNKVRWDELTSAISNVRRSMDIQDVKAAFVEQRIKELRTPNESKRAITD